LIKSVDCCYTVVNVCLRRIYGELNMVLLNVVSLSSQMWQYMLDESYMYVCLYEGPSEPGAGLLRVDTGENIEAYPQIMT
jgi:hypothetical protein